MKDVPTFRDTSFDALIGCDVLDQIPNLIFNLSKRIVSWGDSTPKSHMSVNSVNACVELSTSGILSHTSGLDIKRNTNPSLCCNQHTSNQFITQHSTCETEHIEPYAFPAIMESETEAELQGSFSVWQNGVNPSEGSSIVQNEQTPESTSTQVSETQSSGNMLENLVVALTQALHDRSKVANTQGKFLNEGKTTNQMDENERIYQETEEFYQQFDDPVCFAQEQDIPFCHSENFGLSSSQKRRLRQTKPKSDRPMETLRHPKSQVFRRPQLINFQ